MKRLSLIVLLIIVSSGCEVGRRLYVSATHKIVRNTTDGMLPNVKEGDLAVVGRNFYQNKPVERFDLVVVRDPQGKKEPNGSDTYYLKRVIGLGDEEVRISNSKIYINGRLLREPYSIIGDEPADDFGPLKVPPGEYFLLGDNRPNSYDSRYWEKPTVDKGYIYGKVLEVWPEE